jgi:hypothetical protein
LWEKVAIGGLRPPFFRTPMLCIGYGEAKTDEGSVSADRDPSSGASRHLLPQGEKGNSR